MHIAVTGANGFVGSRLCGKLENDGYIVHRIIRTNSALEPKVNDFIINELNGETNWNGALDGIDVVVHCAARVHVMNDKSNNPLFEFRKVNLDGTLNLAKNAIKSGVKRFIYLSSIKVLGESSSLGRPFEADDPVDPRDPYAISKVEAELGLWELSKVSSMEIVCLRPPLVYGDGVKGNVGALLRMVHSGIPLPFGSVNNRRTLLCLDNLTDFIECCIKHPKARGQVFLVGDANPVSTTDLIEIIRNTINPSGLNIKVNQGFLELALKLIGRSAAANRLFGSLELSIEKNKILLDWVPKIDVRFGIEMMANSYAKNK